MGWMDWFKGDEPVVQYQYEPKEVSVAFDSKGLRNGSWVMTEEGVGIMTAEGVALAKEDGTNKMVVIDDKAVVAMSSTVQRQALLEEIPASRRPDSVANRMFGYK